MLMNAPDIPAAERAASASRYVNRELSWLAFNSRVLAEAENERYPLLERLRFLSISASNLDEFTMIRIAGLEGQASRGIESPGIDGASPRQQLAAIRAAVLAIESRQQAILADLRTQLTTQGVVIADVAQLTERRRQWLCDYFESDIVPPSHSSMTQRRPSTVMLSGTWAVIAPPPLAARSSSRQCPGVCPASDASPSPASRVRGRSSTP